MGYLKTKLSMQFKDYNSLEANGVSKVTKTYYLNNKESVEENVKKVNYLSLKSYLRLSLLLHFS